MTQQAVTISTYLGKTKAKAVGVALLVWLFLFASGLVTKGCSLSPDASTRVSICSYTLTLSSFLPLDSHRVPVLYLYRAIAYIDLGDAENGLADFVSAILEEANGRPAHAIIAKNPPYWFADLDKRMNDIGEGNVPALNAWKRAVHTVVCQELDTVALECNVLQGSSSR